MIKITCFLALLLASLSAAPSAHQYEITPTLGGVLPEENLDLSTQLTYGLKVGVMLEKSIFNQIEFGFDRSAHAEYQYSMLETDINRYYGNVIKEYKMTAESALYALVGLGYEDIRHEHFDTKDSMFAQYGGGVKYWVSDHLALKAEVRHALSFQKGDNSLVYSLGFVLPLDTKIAPVAVKNEPKTALMLPVSTPLDSDKDGISDAKDKCPNTPLNVLVDEQGCMKSIRLQLGFDKAQTRLSKESDEQIDTIVNFLKANSAYTVVLEGHSDAKGSQANNQALSEQRAQTVARALVNRGIAEEKIRMKGHGARKPIASNETQEGRIQNRRVDVLFTY